ncbi:site-specific integrase [Aeromicrobium sp. CnD17-E]|uniref:tyrosine-type recombinase/integrase n=1 Tax=Aeromicrobium sp. CnD17-E TaxID=2954487 RepID=UPI002096F8EA|nr:site-specific integrase [Aeromicrobium sp. CnD17-E]MCO7239067.1 site-specific integrase [Aeromicrobium sp. CnD17-E]
MPRPPNPPYTLGAVTTKAHPSNPSLAQARGYYRDALKRRVDVTASGKTAAAAKRALHARVDQARAEHRGGDAVLNQSTSLPRAAEVWFDSKQREDLSQNTLRDYRGYIDRTIKTGQLSRLTLSEANDVARIEAWLTEVADYRGATAARQARKVLSGILGLAERRGALASSVMHRVKTPGTKPGTAGDRKCSDTDCDHECGKRHLDTARAFTRAEAQRVQEVADRAAADVGDLAAFLLGTGARISEALHHTAWNDVDLESRTVRVRGTKTSEADRTLVMSKPLTERLRHRAGLHGQTGLVFGITYFTTKAGQPRDRNNVSKALRRVFKAAEVPWAGTHTFRRTVASWLDEAGAPLAEIANQLGHADINVTARYLGRRTAPSRAADIMLLPSDKPTLSLVGGE